MEQYEILKKGLIIYKIKPQLNNKNPINVALDVQIKKDE